MPLHLLSKYHTTCYDGKNSFLTPCLDAFSRLQQHSWCALFGIMSFHNLFVLFCLFVCLFVCLVALVPVVACDPQLHRRSLAESCTEAGSDESCCRSLQL